MEPTIILWIIAALAYLGMCAATARATYKGALADPRGDRISAWILAGVMFIATPVLLGFLAADWLLER